MINVTCLSIYHDMKRSGATAHQVYQAAKVGGLDQFACIRALRQLFDLTLAEAKGVMIEVDHGMSISDWQGKLAVSLEQAFAELDASDRDLLPILDSHKLGWVQNS